MVTHAEERHSCRRVRVSRHDNIVPGKYPPTQKPTSRHLLQSEIVLKVTIYIIFGRMRPRITSDIAIIAMEG